MGRSNPSIQSVLAIKKYLTSVHCLLRAMYIQRKGKRMGGKKEANDMETSWVEIETSSSAKIQSL